MIPTKLIKQKKNSPLAILKRLISNAESVGMPYVHADGNTYHFQCRVEDRINWNGLRFVIENQSELTTVPMRCKENVWLTLHRTTALSILLNIGLYYMTLKRAETHIKDNLISTDECTTEKKILKIFNDYLASNNTYT